MKLTFSPVRMDVPLTASVLGDVLTLNGEALDFEPLMKGATLPRVAIDCDWISGDVWRDESGQLCVPLVLPHGAAAPESTLFPEPLTVNTDGPIALPLYAILEAEHVED